jgi:hypothetical protein
VSESESSGMTSGYVGGNLTWSANCARLECEGEGWYEDHVYRYVV